MRPWVVFPAGTASGTVTNATVTSDLFHNLDSAKGCVIVIHRTAETGTCTLAAKLQGYFRPTDTWYDVANSDVVTFADGATGIKYVVVYPGMTGSDADGVLLQDTDFSLVNGFLPYEFRLSVTHGGTSVTNTFGAVIYPLP